jgi:Uma2 family endonuclease
MKAMPTLLEHVTRTPRAVAWTRDDCRRMDEIGLLPERWELVRGEVIDKMGQKLPHGNTVLRVAVWLLKLFGEDFVTSQVTIDVSPADNPTSEPEPDVIVLAEPASSIVNNPRPEQILLLVEVSDTTLRYDLQAKATLYAAAGINEYWVVDLRGRELHQHREPLHGQYQSIQVLDAQAFVEAPGGRGRASVESFLS